MSWKTQGTAATYPWQNSVEGLSSHTSNDLCLNRNQCHSVLHARCMNTFVYSKLVKMIVEIYGKNCPKHHLMQQFSIPKYGAVHTQICLSGLCLHTVMLYSAGESSLRCQCKALPTARSLGQKTTRSQSAFTTLQMLHQGGKGCRS